MFGKKQHKESKGEEEKATKKQIVQSLLTELKVNYDMLSQGLTYTTNIRGNEIEWFNHPLYFNTYQNAINSGGLIQLSPETQIALNLYYERLEKLENARLNSGATIVPRLYKNSIDSMKELIIALKDTYPLIVEALEKEISNV